MHTGLNFVYFFTPSRRAHDVVHNMSQHMNPFAFGLKNQYNRAQNYMLHVILHQYFYHLVLSINNHKFNNFTLSTVCKDHNRPAIPWYSSKLYWAVGILLLCKSIV